MLLTDDLLLNYKRCQRRVFLSFYGDAKHRSQEKEFLLKLKRESDRHLKETLAKLYGIFIPPKPSISHWEAAAQKTEAMMAAGVDFIPAGVLAINLPTWQLSCFVYGGKGNFTIPAAKDLPVEQLTKIMLVGTPNLLIKQPGRSKFGKWTYTPLNVRYGSRPKSEYKLIAAFHSQLLAIFLGNLPTAAELILRQHDRYKVNLTTWLPKMQEIVADCLTMSIQQIEPEVFISRQRCNLCRWYDHCYQIAKSQAHLSLVPGVTPKRYSHLQNKEIKTLESLATINPDDFDKSLGIGVANKLQTQALALVKQQPIIENIEQLKHLPNHSVELYFDIEAEPDRNLDYLLGLLLVDKSNEQEKFYAFVAEKPEQEATIWQQFLDFVLQYPQAPIFHFSQYEIETIIRLAKLYKTPWHQVETVLNRCYDLHSLVVKSLILPVENYSLKALANWLGFQWRNIAANGEQSVCWYDRWLETGERNLLEAIILYNEDDCRATFILKKWLESLTSNC